MAVRVKPTAIKFACKGCGSQFCAATKDEAYEQVEKYCEYQGCELKRPRQRKFKQVSPEPMNVMQALKAIFGTDKPSETNPQVKLTKGEKARAKAENARLAKIAREAERKRSLEPAEQIVYFEYDLPITEHIYP